MFVVELPRDHAAAVAPLGPAVDDGGPYPRETEGELADVVDPHRLLRPIRLFDRDLFD